MRRKKRAHLPWYWKKYRENVVYGLPCEGDPQVGATGWWNIIPNILWRWKTVAILRASEEIYIGFVPQYGITRLCMVPVLAGATFGMLIGREPVVFFAVAWREGKWQPVELQLIARVQREDPQYKEVLLY